MSSIIYVVPWAICDTDSIYVKKVPSDEVEELEVGTPVWDWCIKKIVPNPDRRSKDKYAIIDVIPSSKSTLFKLVLLWQLKIDVSSVHQDSFLV